MMMGCCFSNRATCGRSKGRPRREHEVEHHQIVAIAVQQPVHGGRIGGRGDGVSLPGEVALQQIAQAQVVVDDEDSGLGFGHGAILAAVAAASKRTVTVDCREKRGYKDLQMVLRISRGHV